MCVIVSAFCSHAGAFIVSELSTHLSIADILAKSIIYFNVKWKAIKTTIQLSLSMNYYEKTWIITPPWSSILPFNQPK